MNSRPRPPIDERLLSALASCPVMASVVGTEAAAEFATVEAPLGVLASISLGDLEDTVGRLGDADKTVFVNMDSTPGLGHDPGALSYLQRIGAPGICSTRGAIIERARGLGLLTMQKVFITDRSNMHRSIASVGRSRPDLVQVMPALVLRYIEEQARELDLPYVAAGFVQNESDVADALRRGAVAAGTSDRHLWNLRRAQVNGTHSPARES